MRAYHVSNGPPLQLWHTYVPPEPGAADIDRADWQTWLADENAVFANVRANVTDRLPPSERIPSNRYFAGSPLYPPRFDHDWNRSYLLRPTGAPVGAVVLLHGLTDSPYSLRHVAERYVEHSFVAVGIRLPAHGTVPAALTRVDWETWMAAARLAVIGNTGGDARVSERVVEPGRTVARYRPLALAYPSNIFSLSHVALPFPPDDPLYGFAPAATDHLAFGVELDSLALRAERGVLAVSLDALFRIGSNLFFPYVLDRLDEWIDHGARAVQGSPQAVQPTRQQAGLPPFDATTASPCGDDAMTP